MERRTNMRQFTKYLTIFLFSSSVSVAYAGPWFTGPLLAPAGHTVPKGHTNLEVYGIDVFTDGQYNASGQRISTPKFKTFAANPILTHGFTDWLDVQLTVPYLFNSTRGVHENHLADVSTALGIQILEQKGSPKRIDFRVLLQETIPTGRYDQLNPALLGTDATGLGSYQTLVGLDFQYLLQVFKTHYLRTRFIASRLFSSNVHIDGLSSYGGSINTHGTVKPGIENNLDLAFEFTLTQHWVAVMEGYIATGKATRFNGILNFNNIGSPPVNVSDLDAAPVVIGNASFREEALAPAIEYNFNENIGVIGGVWFPVSGVNTSHYMTYVLAINAFW
ncbi:hypothetical protein D7217_06320 [Legionella pneumophila]|nr:hypothetical protein D7217_06320 [Legionella pneumophila]HAT9855637.1 hypothetical protein [Legionella pneumophila subsp. pneumophila]HAT8673884.1 hypothetical protein [Legionella pneumophila]HAU1021430.1 hypothetical protein [Legionella pneumophila]HAU1058781.1 hypothetical protein [Legionella pneumophila]